jgi:hypothetical protein
VLSDFEGLRAFNTLINCFKSRKLNPIENDFEPSSNIDTSLFLDVQQPARKEKKNGVVSQATGDKKQQLASKRVTLEDDDEVRGLIVSKKLEIEHESFRNFDARFPMIRVYPSHCSCKMGKLAGRMPLIKFL